MTSKDLTTEPEPGAAPARPARPAKIAAVALGVLAALLAVACVVVLVWPTAVPGRSAAEEADDRDRAARTAATKATKAFLEVDYRDMDPLIERVLSLSTGTFKNQYETAKASLKTEAQAAKAVASGAVRRVGIGTITEDSAVVYVAADSKISNTLIEKERAAGKDVEDQRYYRFQLDLKKVGDRWLLENLQFIS